MQPSPDLIAQLDQSTDQLRRARLRNMQWLAAGLLLLAALVFAVARSQRDGHPVWG